MKKINPQKPNFLNTLTLIAKILSTLIIAFLLFFALGHVFAYLFSLDTESQEPESPIKPIEMLGFLFFPIGFLLGLILAYKHELLGGIISLVSLIFFNIFIYLTNNLFPLAQIDFMNIVLLSPSILFIILGVLKRK